MGEVAPFTWGAGGARLTPEEIAQRRKDAALLVQQGTDASPLPVGTRGFGVATQGLARVAKALSGAMDAKEADSAAKANAEDNKTMIASLLGGSQSAPVASAAAPTDQPRGIRNNNPLNIEDGDFAKGQPGYTGTDGRFAKFETPEHGTAAASSLLDSYGRRGLNTVAGVVGRWAPAGEAGNNPSAYAANVAKQMGIAPDAPLTPQQRPALIAAMGQQENGVPIQVASADPSFVPSAAPNPNVAKVAGALGLSPATVAGAQYPSPLQANTGIAVPGPVNIPGMPAAPVAAAANDDGEEDTPPNATPTQGALPPAVAKVAGALGAPVAAPSAPAPAAPNPNVAKVQAALQAFTSPYADASTKQIAGMVLQQAMKPQVAEPYHDADGNLVQKAPDGTVHVLSAADKSPKWGVVGKDQYGQPTYGYPPTREEFQAAQKTKAAGPASDAPDLTNVHGKEYVDTLAAQDPKYASQVQAILEGRAPYPTGMLLKTPYGQRLAQDVTQSDPSFEAGNATARVKVRNEFNSGGVGSPAGQITAGNAAIKHAGEMSDSLEQMKANPGMMGLGENGIPFVSYYANKFHNAAVQGTPEGSPLNDFKTAKNHFSEEVTKFYAGSAGSEAERARALANIDEAKSLPELRSAIRKEAGLMQDKVNTLQERWRNGMGPLVSDFPLISKNSQDAIDRIKQRAALSAQGPAPDAPAAASIPAPAVAKLAQNPTPEMKAHFDEVFGVGAADRALSGGK